MMRVPLLCLVWVGCTGDVEPLPSRGGLAVRLVVAEPDDDEDCDVDDPDTGDTGDDDDDDDDDDDERTLRSLHLDSIEVLIDELRLVLMDDDESRTVSVPVTRRLDLVGPASSQDEIVVDLELADYTSSIVELLARPEGGPALTASGSACVEGESTTLRPVRLEIDEPLGFASSPLRLVLGNGPDPRVKLGLRVDHWLDGVPIPPGGQGPWVIDASSPSLTRLVANIEANVVAEVD